MATYTYRCPTCRTTSPGARTHAEALDEQTYHRDETHGGHIPDGDGITVRRTESWAEADTTERWITAVLVAAVLLFIAYNTL